MEKQIQKKTKKYAFILTCAFLPESSDKPASPKAMHAQAGLLTYSIFCGLPVCDRQWQ